MASAITTTTTTYYIFNLMNGICLLLMVLHLAESGLDPQASKRQQLQQNW